jgi:hypothetical protein
LITTRSRPRPGPFDDWLARIVCFAFSISPQGLVQQMNRATAQTQKELLQEEGLAPVLAWVKGLIDDILADEFSAPDLEFVWSADPSIDPQTQETILSSYTTKGILTINEARAALGREPLANAAANQPMALTGNGYVALGDQAKPAGHVTKYNPYHDEDGRFTTADGVGAASDRSRDGGARVAQLDPRTPVQQVQNREPEEENRGLLEEFIDPLAELRQEQWGREIRTLRALDPNNRQLSNMVPHNWVPTNENIADIRTEIANVAVRRVTNFVMPGGNLIGEPGGGYDVREVPGGAKAAQQAFDYLSVGGTPYTGSYSRSGQMVVLPGNTGWVGLRTSDQGLATVDVRVPGVVPSIRFHYK